MATYKVIQDIEAEDKLLGPLSFRQFVYFLIAAFLGYLNFVMLASGAWFLCIIFAPPMFFCLFFAWPWTPDQPTEVWAVARIRFLFKPRRRIWDQSGIKEFVTITAPKKVERAYTDGLSQIEVRSRLQALAHTIDSRGWAVKNAYGGQDGDRLLQVGAAPMEVSDIRDSDDILDEMNNPTAYNLGQMINESTRAHRASILERMNASATTTQPAMPAQQWFTQPTASPSLPPVMGTATMAPQPQAAPVEPVLQLPQQRPKATQHLKQIQPITDMSAEQPVAPVQPQQTAQPAEQPVVAQEPAKPVVSQPDPAILSLAHDNNLDVATLAREAKRAKGELSASDGEVVISLH